ncbi:homoserine O-succinyltransferase [Lachnospiraceae bacterium KM106-2]|nr:homoserine O-succinyltransferase [Lachnospiraceae bacterium KM106-2]
MYIDYSSISNAPSTKIIILNLMPLKEDTEKQLITCLSHAPMPMQVTFLTTATYECKHTSKEHMDRLYKTLDQVRDMDFDGMIITGAPVEQLEFQDVIYWNELTEIMDWADTHVKSTLHICWGAQAGIYHHYGVAKKALASKLSGVYTTKLSDNETHLFDGFDGTFTCPHSRHTTVSKEEIEQVPELVVLAESKETDVFIAASKDHKHVFVFGHPEYDRDTLDKEYRRDLHKVDCTPHIPYHYYPDNDMNQKPIYSWHKDACNFYRNWVKNYVMEQVPAYSNR